MSEQPRYSEAELVERISSIDVRAPERLHDHIQALVEERSAQARGPWSRPVVSVEVPALRWRVAGAVAVAAAAVAAVLVLNGGGASGPLTPRNAAPLTLRAATLAAPAQSARHPTDLDVSVQGVSFPYWGADFGWRSSGARTDRVDGKTVKTVFYTDGAGQRIGYAIAAGAAPRLDGGAVAWRNGAPYRMLEENGVWAVVWTRDGHLCVVSGRNVDRATLLKLASASDDDVPA